MADAPEGFVAGNYFDKYRTGNPVYRALLGRFLRDAGDLVAVAAPGAVLEVGCGPGDLAGRLFPPEGSLRRGFVGTDVCAEEIHCASGRYPHLRFVVADARRLPFEDGRFDLVIACEVLEHLPDPEHALAECARVSRRHVLASVPWEPWWRGLNLLRGAYVRRLGNTPGHLQNFTRSSFRRLLARELDLVAERRPFPWTMVLGRVPPDRDNPKGRVFDRPGFGSSSR
jgi:SAM-dependent methyltransferase